MQDRMSSPSGKSDWSALMLKSMEGDTAAYRQLLNELAPVLRGIVRARAFGMDYDWCEDVVQDSLMAIHLKKASWDCSQPLRPWVYAIARHKLVDAFRRKGRRVHLPIETFDEVLEAPAQADQFETRDAARLIDRLPDRDAALLRCLALEERGQEECARRLGLTPGALRVTLHRALKKLAAIRHEEEL